MSRQKLGETLRIFPNVVRQKSKHRAKTGKMKGWAMEEMPASRAHLVIWPAQYGYLTSIFYLQLNEHWAFSLQ